MGVRACNAGTGEAEMGGSLGLTGQPASLARLVSYRQVRDSSKDEAVGT